MAQKYKVLKEQQSGLQKDMIVYMYYGPTYGLDSDDFYHTGEFYVCVSENEGQTPFKTCKESDLLKL